MIIKNITQVGNPIIRKRSGSVKNIQSKETKKIIKDLTESMRYGNLVGIAAPQIGINKRIFLTEIRTTTLRKIDSKKELDDLRIFINPKIIHVSKNTHTAYEGCGSVALANIFGKVKRPKSLVIKAFNEKGKKFELKASGLLARVILHEMDHLNGIIFLDKLSDTKTLMSTNEYRKKFAK